MRAVVIKSGCSKEIKANNCAVLPNDVALTGVQEKKHSVVTYITWIFLSLSFSLLYNALKKKNTRISFIWLVDNFRVLQAAILNYIFSYWLELASIVNSRIECIFTFQCC